MNKKDVKRLLKGREVVDDYRDTHTAFHSKARTSAFESEHTALQERLEAGLQTLGFESIDAFFKFNEQACRGEASRCFAIRGECDFSIGRKRGCTPICYDLALSAEKQKVVQALDFHTSLHYWRNFPGNVPPGCSIWVETLNEPAFDIHWGMGGSLSFDRYQKEMLNDRTP